MKHCWISSPGASAKCMVMYDRRRFQDKTVLVTGAAGGIGRATARGFFAEGARLVAADLNGSALREFASEFAGGEDTVIPLSGDLANETECGKLIESAVEKTGRLDVLVNNAGLMRRGDILATSDEDWALSLDVNVTAVFRLCRAAIAHMRKSGGGAIVNVASTWGIYPGPNHVAYCTSKAAVAAMTRCLGRDHAADGIRVNAVCPNEVNTPMLRTGFAVRGFDPDRAVEQLNASVPLGRIAEPEEIADVILFLASDDARYMAGSLVEVNGAKPVY